jgi:hypothetical protein
MKKLISNPIRILRIILGITAIYYAYVSHDYLLGLAGGIFTLMGVLNTGCCLMGSCNTSSRFPPNRKQIKEVEAYEEIT